MSSRQCIELLVSDTGHGIPPEIIGKVFDPYFTTREVGEGSGMGLSIVHGIVSGMLGKIEIDSDMGKGTTVRVLLPAIEKEWKNAPEEENRAFLRGTERILAVDDETTIVNLESRALVSLGYRVTTATNSRETLELFRSNPDEYDLLLTDMTMPGMTGIELKGRIREIRPDFPAILCTGYSELINEETAIAAGVDRYLLKPIGVMDLGSAVRSVLNQRTNMAGRFSPEKPSPPDGGDGR